MITVVVAKDGTTTVSVEGVQGPSCRDLTAKLEAALGTFQKLELTPEYYLDAGEQEVDQHV